MAADAYRLLREADPNGAQKEPNPYEARQAQRRARYEERAAQATREAGAHYARVRRIGDLIPPGQPILIGHHSERRHRADLERMDRGMRQMREAAERAQHYERRAAGVGHGGISSDDPDALAKLRAKLANLEATHARLKATKKALRAKDPTAALAALGFTAEQAAALMMPDYTGKPGGVKGWQLTNSSANIRDVRQRIAHLEAAAARPVPQAREVAGVRVEESAEDSRLRLFFPGKPAEAVRAELKRWGFRWSPTNMAWQRQRSNAATYAAERVLAFLREQPAPDATAQAAEGSA
jgi:hypothetical protein